MEALVARFVTAEHLDAEGEAERDHLLEAYRTLWRAHRLALDMI